MASSAFKYYLPTRVVFEPVNNLDLGPYLQPRGKTLLVISKSLHQRRPDIAASLEEGASIYDDVGTNPSLQQLMEVPISLDCTQVIGIGGGSKLDAAKALFARILTAGKVSLEDLIQFYSENL